MTTIRTVLRIVILLTALGVLVISAAADSTLPAPIEAIIAGYANQCHQFGGTLVAGADRPQIMTGDFDGDGMPDYVLNPRNLRCSAAATAFCGNGGCQITIALSDQVEFGSSNPVTAILDVETGRLKDPMVRGERVLSAIIECKTAEEHGVEVLKILERVSREIETVFSLCVINRCVDYQIPFRSAMGEAGLVPRINGKVNVGLGRPLI